MKLRYRIGQLTCRLIRQHHPVLAITERLTSRGVEIVTSDVKCSRCSTALPADDFPLDTIVDQVIARALRDDGAP